MAERLSEETLVLLEQADRAIARSRELAIERRSLVVECERKRRAQETRFAFFREMRKLK